MFTDNSLPVADSGGLNALPVPAYCLKSNHKYFNIISLVHQFLDGQTVQIKWFLIWVSTVVFKRLS